MFNPAVASKNIKQEYIDYITTQHRFADNTIQQQLLEQLNSTVSKGPYLEMKDVFKSGKSIRELVTEGVLSPEFINLESGKPQNYKRKLPIDRPLHLHQEYAVRKLVDGENLIVSTGTGSGKTNCFLIPVLNQLMREKEAGTLNAGIRALFIYPMNALANDQIKNIRHILMYYPDISFGVYNGGTAHDEATAISLYKTLYSREDTPELKNTLPNELLSRDEMKNNPPNILFTNYAMLEHLLFRPNDDKLFSEANFSFVVLDEAHIYTGATGIETSMLLRRLQARIRSNHGTQFVLTSATLGSGEDDNDDIVKFAENLCGVQFKKDNIIRAYRENYVPQDTYLSYPNSLYIELVNDQNIINEVFDKYSINYNPSANGDEQIYDFIIQTDLYSKLRSLDTSINDINDIAKVLGTDTDTTVAFVSLCTRAQKNGKSLLDARYHFFIRTLEGAFIALSPSHKLMLNRNRHYNSDGKDYSVFEVATCDECGKYAILGIRRGRQLTQSDKITDDVDFFFPEIDYSDTLDDDDIVENKTELESFKLCRICGAIKSTKDIHGRLCDCGEENNINVIKARKTASGIAKCGACNRGNYSRFYLGNDAATSVLATSLFEEIPAQIYIKPEAEKESKPKGFLSFSNSRKVPKAERSTRQFLIFSDSRQEAAKFACYLGDNYKSFVRRRGIYQIINERHNDLLAGNYTISDCVSYLSNYFSTKRSFSELHNNTDSLMAVSQKQAWVAMLDELCRSGSATSLTALGILQFKYRGNDDNTIINIAQNYGVSLDTVRNLLDILITDVIKAKVIITDNDSDLGEKERQYLYYSNIQHSLSRYYDESKKKLYTHWMPINKKGDTESFNRTNRMTYVQRALNCSPSEANYFLGLYFDFLTDPEAGNKYPMTNFDGNSFVMPARNFEVKIAGDPSIHWYRCKKCSKVSTNHINGCCLINSCEGEVEEINPSSLNSDNHYSNLYKSDNVTTLIVKEHTAQLSKEEASAYQEQFIKKEINSLSCSTTFEMGVDVGDLETVFLRNVPPAPSNYAQRAGRAGRSVNAAAFALTFAKLNSHDLTFFQTPEKMIGGIIQPPLFKINNEKIVKRHIYDIAISMFLAMNPEMYNHNDAEKFINDKGYLKFIDWLNTKPDSLKEMICKSIPRVEDLYEQIGIDDYSWLVDFIGENGIFTKLINEYENTIVEFKKTISKLMKEDPERVSSCHNRLKRYQKNELIDFLAKGNILPRYGFPVDTVELEQNSSAKNVNKLRLSRDLQLAIAEYAPSAEVVADGRLYTSRYIKKSTASNNKKEWDTAYIGTCPNRECQTINYSLVPITSEGICCSSCKTMIKGMHFRESIEPRAGFIAEKESKDVPLTKQTKVYRSEDFYIGDKQARNIDKQYYAINGIEMCVESTSNDSLLVKSYKSFYVCNYCGFAYADDEFVGNTTIARDMAAQMNSIEDTKSHSKPKNDALCDNKKLHRRTLHHLFHTDVAKITFSCDTSNFNTMYSVMYALLYAVSNVLNIEKKDIKACLSKRIIDGVTTNSIIIYDSVPGGAGHSRRLVTDDGKILGQVIKSAIERVSKCNCDPSCYNCLRSYENQRKHDVLDRKLAAEFLSIFDGEIMPVEHNEELPFEF